MRTGLRITVLKEYVKKEHKKHSPNECVALVLEHSDLLDGSEGLEGLLHEVLREAVGQAAAVDRAVGGTRLVVDFVESERLRVH